LKFTHSPYIHISSHLTLFWVLIDVFVSLRASHKTCFPFFPWVVRFVNQYLPVLFFPPCTPPNGSDFSPDQSTAACFARPEVSTTRRVLSRLQQRHHSTNEYKSGPVSRTRSPESKLLLPPNGRELECFAASRSTAADQYGLSVLNNKK